LANSWQPASVSHDGWTDSSRVQTAPGRTWPDRTTAKSTQHMKYNASYVNQNTVNTTANRLTVKSTVTQLSSAGSSAMETDFARCGFNQTSPAAETHCQEQYSQVIQQ